MLSSDSLKYCFTFVPFPSLLAPQCSGILVMLFSVGLNYPSMIFLALGIYCTAMSFLMNPLFLLEELPLQDLSRSMLALQREMHIWPKTNKLLSFHWIVLEYKKASVQLLGSESSLCTSSCCYLPTRSDSNHPKSTLVFIGRNLDC